MYCPVKILNNRWKTAISTNFRDQNLTVRTWFFWKNNALFCLSITSTSIYVNLLLIKIKNKWRFISSTKQIDFTKSVVNILALDTSKRFLLSQIKLNKSKRSPAMNPNLTLWDSDKREQQLQHLYTDSRKVQKSIGITVHIDPSASSLVSSLVTSVESDELTQVL